MRKVNWDSVIDTVQAGLVWFVIFVVTICTATLVLFDVLAGAGVMNFLTSNNLLVAIFISLATTGLLLALMFIGYTMSEKENALAKSVGWTLLGVAFLVYCIDIYFDSLTADVLRFAAIVSVKDITNPQVHMLFRALIGGISTVGEALAVSIIVGMPVLKKFINNAMPVSRRSYTAPRTQSYNSTIPLSIPRADQAVTQRVRPAAELIRPKTATPTPRQRGGPILPEPTYHPIGMKASDSIPEFNDDILAQSQLPLTEES